MHVGLQSGKSALQLAEAWGHSEVLKVLCEHGARGALCYAAKNDLRDMLAELISKGHDLEERDQVLVYEALSCAQVLVYEAYIYIMYIYKYIYSSEISKLYITYLYVFFSAHTHTHTRPQDALKLRTRAPTHMFIS